MIGETIAHYRIVAKLGEGGMGEVYRALDTKLDRGVALKILPINFASDADRMARFEREAKVLASLNHPNIAQIYGVEERALVMELVEGESPKGPMAFEDAWKIASQIAEALEYAHEKGIVHRDLKPANLKVTSEGVVKLLDFGLAKAFTEPKEPSGNAEQSPTLTIGATEVGMILGTAAYMSPEQAKGKSVDKRADIWAFGVVLYELLTGERLFMGDDVADTLAQVLTKEPNWDQVPANARTILAKCLEKDPKQRLRDIGDARFLETREESLVSAPGPQGTPSRLGNVGWIAAAVFFVAFGVLSLIQFRATPVPVETLRYSIPTPENETALRTLALSPDGRSLAIGTIATTRGQLWVRSLDAFQARPILGTEGAVHPFWSPDSRSIGFFAQGKLKKIAVNGGPAQSLCDAPDGRGGSWNRDNEIVFAPNGSAAGTIQRVSAAGGVPSDVLKSKGGVFRYPVFLPDGNHFLYSLTGVPPEQLGIYVSSLDGSENRRILPDPSNAVFAAHRLLFVRDGSNLVAQTFDVRERQLTGEVYPLAEGILQINGYAPIAVSKTGLLVYLVSTMAGYVPASQMGWFDRGGKLLQTIGAPGPVGDPALSPNQKSLVFRRQSNSGSGLWLLRDLTRPGEQRFTIDPAFNTSPIWSPGGDRIVFRSTRGGVMGNLYQKTASGTGPDELLLADDKNKIPTQWSRDGKFVVYSEQDPKTGYDIAVLPMEGREGGKPVLFLHSQFNELFGQISPDGHWMAYTSDESGQREVYVRPFPSGDGQWRISIAGGEQPRWRGDGKELFFIGGDGKMTAVMVNASPAKASFEPGTLQQLFDAHLVESYNSTLFEYDVSPDGKHFLLSTAGGGSAAAPVLNVVMNWDTGLKK